MSIKTDRQVTSSGFPDHFVEAAWEHWLGIGTARKLRANLDAVVLVTGQLANTVQEAWDKILREALESTPERMLVRLTSPTTATEGSQSSKQQRNLFKSLRCPDGLKDKGVTDDAATIQLLRHVRLLHYDFASPTSRDQVQAVAACQQLLQSGNAAEAEELWSRLLSFASEQRATGGSADLSKLLAALRNRFILIDHPDYRADWDRLTRHTRELLDDVHTTISGLVALERTEELAAMEWRLNERGLYFAAGESGSGKSALAKTCAERYYARVFWVTEELLDTTNLPQIESRLGLQHSLVEVLIAASGRCLVVFDSVERFSETALRLMARLIRDIRQHASAEHVHILLTLQFEATRHTVARLTEHGIDRSLLEISEVHRLSEDQVEQLVQRVPSLRWALLRPELRSLLTNLKILEWVVQAAQASQHFDMQGLVSLTALIDRLWERWVDGGGRELARSGLLMHLGILESETLAAGVARTHLGYAEQQALPSLINADLVRVRNERVRFTHDLLGDWARLRVLVSEDPTASTTNRQRAALPRWHRAVRLYAQRLLESGSEGVAQWHAALARLEDESDTSLVIRDLFLEALFLATNAAVLLEQAWPMLVENGGRLLNRLLDRFLFVATFPDPRLVGLLGDEATAIQVEHLYRIPFGAYRGPVLTTLHAHCAEVVSLVLVKTAHIVRLWLRTVSTLRNMGRLFPWRQEAAELALAVAREFRAPSEEDCYFPNHEGQVAYEAVLYAASELPEEAGLFCLEMAQRRDLEPDIQARVARTGEQRQEEQRRLHAANLIPSGEVEVPSMPGLHDGPLRDPWPDGPRERVCDSFQKACLESDAFPDLIRARPYIALEVLLAVCIEEPQHDNPYDHLLTKTVE